MLLSIGWIIVGVESVLALGFGFMFAHFWSHAAMSRTTRRAALAIYAAGCIFCLLLAVALPL